MGSFSIKVLNLDSNTKEVLDVTFNGVVPKDVTMLILGSKIKCYNADIRSPKWKLYNVDISEYNLLRYWWLNPVLLDCISILQYVLSKQIVCLQISWRVMFNYHHVYLIHNKASF